ncbi:SusC/RagA family TonB-linked outer membrane protein [Arcicella lustrica]|uniref:SusC/RagA family TonB-linked outer membrane protein n=1 Tax=Arcicella lustrica TaxID=2984196 RepID=A0ABU5SFA3_9BACT|nr:SusC/RagA family TonB-linked outer membrane protein [Arcicella sp. DC25W]MEA5425954.1 SusC/RagA family TonB-linked outer membrane protein [Arcicella sp. DC25W]
MNRKLLMIFVLMLTLTLKMAAQDRIVSGKVTSSEDGAVLAGVSVSVKGTSKGTTSAADGSYKISVPNNATLTFGFVGFIKQDIAVGTKTIINVALVNDVTDIEEVVVVGYGTTKKQNLTASQANISGKALEGKAGGSTFDNLLQGKAAGLQITSVNGRPSGQNFIRIRGEGSLTAGSQPLVVIDGVPVANSEAQGGINILNTINPNEIEDVQVLKDASSAAIYGSRGANGVILVTTKQGKKGLPKITYSFQAGYSEKTPDNFKMMTFEEKLRYEKDLGYTNGYFLDDVTTMTDAEYQAEVTRLSAGKTDWFKTLLQKGQLRTHRLGISGANDAFSYNIGLQTSKVGGLVNGSNSDLNTGRINLEYRASKWLKTGSNLQFSVIQTNEQRDRYNVQNPFYAIYAYNAYEPEFNDDGTYNLTANGFSISEAILNNTEKQNIVNGLGSFFVALTPIKDLEVRSQIGLTYTDYAREYYIKPNSILDQYVGDPAARGSKTDNGFQNFNYVFTNTATYFKSIDDTHNFKILGGIEFTRDRIKTYTLSSKGFPSDKVSTQDNSSTPTGASTGKSDWALYSLFGRINYDFNQKYFLDLSVRRDGSSRFGINNRYGLFGAASAGWHLDKESFIQDLTFINSLKLRASYGLTGNDRIGNYTSLGLYRYNSYGLTSATFPSQVQNPDLTWEKLAATDIGVDFSVLNNRLYGTVDWYNKNNSSLLYDRPLSSTTGFQSRTENVGAVQNRGLEFTLGYKILNTKDLKWDVNVNYSINKNKVTALTEDGINRPGGLSKLQIGQPIDVYFMTRYAGVNSQTGAQQFYNINGEIVENYSPSDAVVLEGKSRLATRFGNFHTDISYKGFSLGADLYYSGGNYIFNSLWNDLTSDGEYIYNNQAADALNYWKKAGDTGVLPEPTGISYTTDRYLQKGDFIRLRNVTLGYTIPTGITKKAKIQSVRIYAQAQNWWYHAFEAKGDPEIGFGQAESTGGQTQGLFRGYSYPVARQLTFGIDLTF